MASSHPDLSVGLRVVVRSRTGGFAVTGRPELTDVVGRVLAIDEESVTVQRRDGQDVTVRLGDVVATRVVPDRPLRRRRALDVSTDQLTAITSRGWPPVETARLGDWELRAADGFTGRANSAAAIGSPGADLAEACRQVERWYAERGLPPMIQTVEGSETERGLERLGWRPIDGERPGAVVQVADLTDTYRTDPDVVVERELTARWLALYERADADSPAVRRVVGGPDGAAFLHLGDPMRAIARVVVTGEWAGLAAVEVPPEHRRQGLARRLVATALAWAVEHGADKAYLQTMAGNTAALALYEPFGFTTHHRYRYLTPTAGPQRSRR